MFKESEKEEVLSIGVSRSLVVDSLKRARMIAASPKVE